MIIAIAAAEIAFWVFLAAGLATRYLLRRERAGSRLLLCVPLVDVALVCFVIADVAGGAPPSHGHAVAAVYLGGTVAFGHSTIAWADARFRHWFDGGPKPTKPPKGSRAEVRAIWAEWLRVVLAGAIAAVGLLALIAVDGFTVPANADQIAASPYWSMMSLIGIVVAIWFLAGPAFAGKGSDAPARR